MLWAQRGTSAWSASKDGRGGGHSGGVDNVCGVERDVCVVIGVAVTIATVVVAVVVVIVVKMTRGGSGNGVGGVCSSGDSERKELIGS